MFVQFLLLMSILGAFSIFELRAVNLVSSEIRDRWLQSTRVLGDLNNYTSDARAAEASRLLAQNPAQQVSVDQAVQDLDVQIARAEGAYQRIPHDAEELRLYARFTGDWQAYRAISSQVLAAARQGRSSEGDALYMTGSLKAYNAASDALGVLTERTVARAGEASNQASATYRTARGLIVASLALAAFGLVIAVNYITRSVSGPLLHLAERMRALANNDTGVEIEGSGRPDEIGEMASAVVVFRSNAIELAHSQQGLVQQATMLEERLQAEQKLTTLQRNFVSMASHEFRTPLTIVDGHAQRLAALSGRLAPDEIVERAGRIRRAAARMRHVIDHLLESSRLFEGQPGLYFHPVTFDPGALLREVCQVHRDISPAARIIEIFQRAPPSFAGDPKLLYQAVSNLVANAVKYSPDGARVEVDCHLEAGALVIRVEDRGLGIPEADLGHVFERYHRGGNVAGIVGTGIGLYLVKMVVDLHGGTVAVDSQEGRGSRFVLTLPPPPLAAGRAASQQEGLSP